MNRDAARSSIANLWQDNRALRVALVALVLSNIVLAYGLAFKSKIVTVVPANEMTRSTYTASSADQGALSSWGLYVANMLGNVTPSTADFTADAIGKLLAPGIYHQVMDQISTQIQAVKSDQLTLRFDVSGVKYDARKNAVMVTGWLTTTDVHGSNQRKQQTYEIYFDVVNYQPRIVGLTAYDGDPKM